MAHQQFTFQAPPTSIAVQIHPFSQAIVASQPVLYPPGTDPYTSPGLYHSTHVVFADTAGDFYPNPSNVDSQSWITKEVTAVRYDASSSVPSTSSNLGNSQCADQPMLDYSTGSVTGQEKMNTGVAFPAGVSSTIAPQMIGAFDAVASQSLEVKRRKLLDGGASAGSVRLCTICNVACNRQEAFNAHLIGKRHVTQSKLMAAGGAGPVFASIRASTWTNGVKKAKTVKSTWCQVCNIECTSHDVYTKHLLGKKHQKNLENFAKPNAVSSVTTDSSGTVQKKKVSSEVDLEAKRQKVLESGAATTAVRVCAVCNVVCNSQKVFDTHVSGQKHQAMVKAQAF